MLERLAFQTRARTIDHLGREQIADCPTAISELWKNAYDAYARRASLHIFDGNPEVAAVVDDGHGMSRDEFVSKWLVVGTESKVSRSATPIEDQNGLSYRKRQGRKGIGRLSAAYLGNLLFFVSKRRGLPIVAALIDWRIFENPFLMLSDIRIPIATVSEKGLLWSELPKLYDAMMGNVWGDSTDEERSERIAAAWASFDALERESLESYGGVTTREKIEATLINTQFDERHVAEWDLWNGKSEHGTAMLISGIIQDLRAQLNPASKSAYDITSIENLRATLWSFVDPFTTLSTEARERPVKDFSTSVIAWRGDHRISVVERFSGFESNAAASLEHIIDGHVDETGCFRGRVKAFGRWLDDIVEIKPETAVPTRSDSRVGAFDFYVGSMEFARANSTHSDEEYRHLSELLSQYSGLMVFRDGFRVMPYGRVDADYFGVEERRSKHAGREFWNHRQMLGRIGITAYDNPNLRDKAGREGIIDNQASKAFRSLVINILKTSARRYFGLSSEIRQENLPKLQEAYAQKKKEEERVRLLERRRRQFRTSLRENQPLVENLETRVQGIQRDALVAASNHAGDAAYDLRTALSEVKQARAALRLGPAPLRLAPKLREQHSEYRQRMQGIDDSIRKTEEQITLLLEHATPRPPGELLRDAITNQSKFVRKRLSDLCNRIERLLGEEKIRVEAYYKARMALFRERVEAMLPDVESGAIDANRAFALIGTTAEQVDQENQTHLEPIVAALEILGERIDLDLIAGESSEEIDAMRGELDRLNSLAQLGITVEIIDHELSGFTATISHGLAELPAEIKALRAYQQVQTGFEGLASRLRFLSPLKLSGEPDYREITGAEIAGYVRDFFAKDLVAGEFVLETTSGFEGFSLVEQRARIFPVFVNLVNNARYWLHQKRVEHPKVLLANSEGRIVIADNGPGIEKQDISELFRLFFTRRKGGRGVGLYLCRVNLAAGGHRISYISDEDRKLLPGANFEIEFRNANHPS